MSFFNPLADLPDLTNTGSTVDVERLETPTWPRSERSEAFSHDEKREATAGSRETAPRLPSTTSSHEMELDSDATGSDPEDGTLDQGLRPPEEYGCPTRDEWRHFVIPSDASLEAVNSAAGVRKRFMDGSKLPIAPVTAAELDDARALRHVILKVNHLPRTWLPFSPGQSMRSLPGILYNPRDYNECCSTCIEKGYLCASLHPSASACLACKLGRLACKVPVHTSTDDDAKVFLLGPIRSDEGRRSTGNSLLPAVQALRDRINKKLRKIFGKKGRKHSPLGKGGYYVAWEPSRAVFDEFTRLRKESWARFGWFEGSVIYYGDPSMIHEGSIASLMHLVQREMETELDMMPSGIDEIDSLVTEIQHEKQCSGYRKPGAAPRTRGVILFEMLLGNFLSTAVDGLDPTFLDLPTRPKRKCKSLKRPQSEKAFVKEPDFLFMYRRGASDNNIAIAGEVAFGNESLKELKNETRMWKGKGEQRRGVHHSTLVSMGLKIDPKFRSDVQCPVDPQIALFVVRDAYSAEEEKANTNGVISEQYNIGRGSGVVLSRSWRARMDYGAHTDQRIRKVVEDVDWSGTADKLVSDWNTPFDEFVMKHHDGGIAIPMARVLSTALSRFLASTTASPATKRPRLDEEAIESTRRRLQSFVQEFGIRLDPADIRALVIQGCLTEYETNLPSLNTSSFDSDPSPEAALPIADVWGFDSISKSSAPPPQPSASPLIPLSERARGKLPQPGNRQPHDDARVGLGLGAPAFDDDSRLEPSTGDVGDR